MIVSITWHWDESHAKIRRVNEKFPRTPLAQSKVSSSFIHPLEDDATTHLALNSSLTNLVSFLAPGKTVKGFHFAQSAFAVRQTKTFVFSWPVVLMANVLWPMESTVVLESMSYKTTVSSIAITSLSVKESFTCSRLACSTYAISLSIGFSRSFWDSVVLRHIHNLCLVITICTHPMFCRDCLRKFYFLSILLACRVAFAYN